MINAGSTFDGLSSEQVADLLRKISGLLAHSDAEAKLAALEKENEDLRSTLTGTEEACEGMQRELERIQTEYNALASTLSGTLDTSNEEEEEF